jgi:hypothetical protein
VQISCCLIAKQLCNRDEKTGRVWNESVPTQMSASVDLDQARAAADWPKRCGNRQQDIGLRGPAEGKTIVLVQDNLNIHRKASLYEAFPAVEARRLVERFE